jgi:hypothetical protein
MVDYVRADINRGVGMSCVGKSRNEDDTGPSVLDRLELATSDA